MLSFSDSRLPLLRSGGLDVTPRGLSFRPVLGPGVESIPPVDGECRRVSGGATAASLGLDLGMAVSRSGSGFAEGVTFEASLLRTLVGMMVQTLGLRGAD